MKSFKEFIRESTYGPEDVLTDKKGNKYTVQRHDYKDNSGKNRIAYEVRLQGKPQGTWAVAGVTMSAVKPKQAMSLHVHHEYQRNGIASALYDYIENDLDIEMEPNWALTDDGEAFWDSRKKNK
jgi:GNAT superfamily N-acetyltransferase